MNRLPSLFAALLLTAPLAFAGKDTDLKPTLFTAGKPDFAADFESGDLAKPWAVAKGEWSVKDGTIIGKEKASDSHPAVLGLLLPKKNSAIRFSFRLDGAQGFNLSLNDANGHLFRIGVNPANLVVNKDADKKDPNSKMAPLGKAEAKFEKGEWYTMLLEMKGGKVAVQTDNGAKVEVTNPALDVDKTGYRFVIKGETLLLDDVKVWDLAE